MVGTVLFYNIEKRYGFIKSKECQDDVYFNGKHLYDPEEILVSNAQVSFDLVEVAENRYQARQVKRIG